MSDRHTDGKVTYIHGAKPTKRLPTMEEVQQVTQAIGEWAQRDPDGYLASLGRVGVTREMLEAGENDPALRQPMPAAPSVRQNIPIQMIYEADVHLDGSVTERHFAHPLVNSEPDEPDEFDVWGTSQNPPPPALYSLNWPLIWLWFCIIAACLTAWYLVAQILGATGLPQFLTQILTTIISPTR